MPLGTEWKVTSKLDGPIADLYNHQDAHFIAKARTDLPAALDLLDKYEVMLLEAKKAVLDLSYNGLTEDTDDEMFDLAGRIVKLVYGTSEPYDPTREEE